MKSNDTATRSSHASNCAGRCPLCGGDNNCQITTMAAYKGACWCARVNIPEELLARVPAESRNRACICARCIAEFHRERTESLARKSPSTRTILAALLLLIAQPVLATQWSESFTHNPAANGWNNFGNTNLFQWDSTNENLAVTWDSSQRGYFFLPLGTVLTKSDDFSFSFDLQLADIAVGVNPNKPYSFELAVGFIAHSVATNANYKRGIVSPGVGARNLCEFDYFPDSGFGATISPTMISTNSAYSQFATVFDFPLELDAGALFTISLSYTASDKTLRTTMTRNGEPFGPIDNVVLGSGFQDFRLDQFAICNYNDAGADGSLLAHGVVDNLVVTVPPPPIQNLSGVFTSNVWRATFLSRSNWLYTLERTTDFQTWTSVATGSGNATNLFLEDSNPPSSSTFYRVKGERP